MIYVSRKKHLRKAVVSCRPAFWMQSFCSFHSPGSYFQTQICLCLDFNSWKDEPDKANAILRSANRNRMEEYQRMRVTGLCKRYRGRGTWAKHRKGITLSQQTGQVETDCLTNTLWRPVSLSDRPPPSWIAHCCIVFDLWTGLRSVLVGKWACPMWRHFFKFAGNVENTESSLIMISVA